MIFGAILAGGTGSRMKISEMPKQFLPLKNKPIILHTIERFLKCPFIDKIYVGVHGDWLDYMNELLDRYGEQKRDKICIVAGGGDRNQTIFNVISAIEQGHGESDEHIIVTHDSVRPFVTTAMIEQNVWAAKEFGACDTVIPATDTIVKSDSGEFISSIPERSCLYQGQTPQSFKINLIKGLWLDLSEDEKKNLTDACKICAIRNVPVKLVMGDPTNIKITTQGDYTIAKSIVGGKNND